MSLVTLATVSIIAIAAGAFSTFWLLAHRKHGGRGERYAAMLEQSPSGTLIADATSLRIIDANLALQQSLGYSLPELQGLLLTQLFADNRSDAEPLAERLRNHDPRLPLQLRLRQLCKNGSTPEVEAVGHHWLIDGQPMFALTTADVTLKSKIEAQLL